MDFVRGNPQKVYRNGGTKNRIKSLPTEIDIIIPMPIGCVTSGVYVMAELNLGRLGHQEKPISQEKLWKKEKKKKKHLLKMAKMIKFFVKFILEKKATSLSIYYLLNVIA